MGPPDVEERSFPSGDLSWQDENLNFFEAMSNIEAANGNLNDALHCLKIVEDIYQKSKALQRGQYHPIWWKGN